MGKKKSITNHLLFMNDLQLFGKNHTLVQTVHMFSRDIATEFGLFKF